MSPPLSLQLGFAALDRTAAKHRRDIQVLVPHAQYLARIRPAGITVSDLRTLATSLRLLPEAGHGRQLSFLGAVLKAAGLVATEQWRRSEIPASHGNNQRVWRLAP